MESITLEPLAYFSKGELQLTLFLQNLSRATTLPQQSSSQNPVYILSKTLKKLSEATMSTFPIYELGLNSFVLSSHNRPLLGDWLWSFSTTLKIWTTPPVNFNTLWKVLICPLCTCSRSLLYWNIILIYGTSMACWKYSKHFYLLRRCIINKISFL